METPLTCGYCHETLSTKNDYCGYGGHDLNELFIDSLPDSERFRCCACLSELTGECCCGNCNK